MIEKYVVSLELAKRMKELGWEKPTYFIWIRRKKTGIDNAKFQWVLWDSTQYADYSTGSEKI